MRHSEKMPEQKAGFDRFLEVFGDVCRNFVRKVDRTLAEKQAEKVQKTLLKPLPRKSGNSI